MISCDLIETNYTVRFDSKGGAPTPQEQTVKEGGRVTKPADPTRDNFSFVGWAKADSETSALWNFETETVSADMTLFARWTVLTHVVTFNSDGGSDVPVQNVAHGGRVTKPATDPTRSGFEFDVWFNGDTEWNFATAITAPITLTARWTAVHAVTFDSDGGSEATTQNVRNGGTATMPEDPTRDGFEFDGWFSGETEWDFATAITAPVTLTAKWAAIHVVTFDSDGGTAVVAQNVRNENVATKPTTDPTRSGFEFVGWFNGDVEWNFATAITAPITLTAKWTALHTVTFDSDGGSAVTAQTVRNGNTATQPTDPTRTIASGLYLGTPTGNFTFDGWYNGETEWNFGAAITEAITLKARWMLPDNVTRIEAVLSNDVAAAFTYVNANSNSGEEYTHLLGTDVTVGTQTLSAANAKLTIIGIGVERTITAIAYSPLFTVNGNNITNLTLGQNITIKRGDGLNIQRGILIMLDGSKITESRIHAINVRGLNAVFKMAGGEISGNNYGVHVENGARCEVSGSSIITGNNGGGYDWRDMFIGYNCTFSLSGNARIGKIFLNAENATTRSTVTIDGNYSGTVTELNLRGNSSNENTIVSWWTSIPIIINGTANVINMFNNGLGDFLNSASFTVRHINATHILNADGFLVQKED